MTTDELINERNLLEWMEDGRLEFNQEMIDRGWDSEVQPPEPDIIVLAAEIVNKLPVNDVADLVDAVVPYAQPDRPEYLIYIIKKYQEDLAAKRGNWIIE